MQEKRDAFRFTVHGHPDKLSVPQLAWEQAYHAYKDDPGISGPNMIQVLAVWNNLVREIGGSLITEEASSHYIHHEDGGAFYYSQIEPEQKIKSLAVLSTAIAHYNMVVSDIMDGRLQILPSGLLDAATYDAWLDQLEGSESASPSEPASKLAKALELDTAPLPTAILAAIAAWQKYWSGWQLGQDLGFLPDDVRAWLKAEYGLDDKQAAWAEKLVRPDGCEPAIKRAAGRKGGRNAQAMLKARSEE